MLSPGSHASEAQPGTTEDKAGKYYWYLMQFDMRRCATMCIEVSRKLHTLLTSGAPIKAIFRSLHGLEGVGICNAGLVDSTKYIL